MRRDRAAAPTLRTAFPSVALIHIDLVFEDHPGRAPAPQSFVLHPPARAFFEFSCPYANCEGRFDLTTQVHAAVEHASSKATGQLDCQGLRPKGSALRQPCGLLLRFAIAAQQQTQAEPFEA